MLAREETPLYDLRKREALAWIILTGRRSTLLHTHDHTNESTSSVHKHAHEHRYQSAHAQELHLGNRSCKAFSRPTLGLPCLFDQTVTHLGAQLNISQQYCVHQEAESDPSVLTRA